VTDAPDIDGTVPPRPRPGSQEARLAGFNLLRRLLIYHLALAAVLAVLLVLVPALPAYLPIGGVKVLAEGTDLTAPELPILPGPGNLDHARQLVLTLAGIWLLMRSRHEPEPRHCTLVAGAARIRLAAGRSMGPRCRWCAPAV